MFRLVFPESCLGFQSALVVPGGRGVLHRGDRVALVRFFLIEVVADSHVTVLRVNAGPPEYLHSWIRSPIVQGRIDSMQTGSTNQVELGRSEVMKMGVPVAPLNEQRRIVAKLAALQTGSRRARQALDAVPDEIAMTPCDSCSGVSREIALYAPRILNDPVR